MAGQASKFPWPEEVTQAMDNVFAMMGVVFGPQRQCSQLPSRVMALFENAVHLKFDGQFKLSLLISINHHFPIHFSLWLLPLNWPWVRPQAIFGFSGIFG
jgi:hypothetical protein